MPIYEYHCGKCGDFEVMQRISDAPLTTCPTCRRKVTKLISSTSFQLKGSGWYVTDYARKGSSGGGKKADEPKAEKGEEKKTDTAADSASKKKKAGGEKAAAA
jgi:putative FmdB family regulatory protein